MGAKNQIHKAIAFSDLLNDRGLLHHTATQCRSHVRIFLFQGIDMPKTAVHSLVGIIPHGAGVVDYKIRFFRLSQLIAHSLQNSRELFGVAGVHLTAEGYRTRI